MNNKIKFILVFILAAVVGFGVVMLVKQSSEEGKHESPITPPSIGSATVGGETEKEKPDSMQSADTIVSFDVEEEVEELKPIAPELKTDQIRVRLYVGKSSYYYTVKGIGVSAESEGIVYTLTDAFGHEYTSDTGSFTQVSANATGTYTLVVHDTATGLLSEPKTIGGFNIIPPVANPLSASELTELIKTGDYDGNKSLIEGRLANSQKIKCSNSNYTANTIQEVFMSVYLENWIITVASLDYNCLGQVTCINLNAQK